MTNESLGGKETAKPEIERKFLVAGLPIDVDLSQMNPVDIRQGYLSIDSEGASRVRQKGSKFFKAWKGKPTEHAAQRPEDEVEISAEEFNELWPQTEGRRIEKTRYHIPDGDYTIELDHFHRPNEGKLLAEVEFPNTTEADAYQPPPWLGLEVTEDLRYGNSSIAVDGFPITGV